MWHVIASIGFIFVLWYLYAKRSLSYWRKRRVPHLKPHILWGDFKKVVYQKSTFFQVYGEIYRRFKTVPYVGLYIIHRPGILIRDPELVKHVVQTDFPSFHKNDLLVDEKVDVIFGGNPFTRNGEEWKTRRAMHTPQFSSGKLKYIYSLLNQGGDRMIQFLNDEINKTGEKCTIDSMELAAKYTIYNAGTLTMAIDSKTFDEDNAEMRDMGRKIMEPNFYNGIKQLVLFILPSLASILTVRLIPDDVTNKFRRMVKENLQYRKENGINRNDFFDDIQEYKGQKTSIDEMIIQIGGVFLDGFATNSSTLTFILYELALNPDVQQTLREEVDRHLSEHNGVISYDVLQEMSYLDAVLSEGLRKYPALAALSKLSTKQYTLPPLGELMQPLTIEPNTPIIIPLIGLHYDEKYFPDPERFDPTRFLGENKNNIQKFTYLPFNEGPRACLGKRYALLQSKVMLLKLVSKFELRLNKNKTKLPIQFDVQSFLLAAKGGVWLDIHKRKN